nr:hypothetical protein OG781_18340 [Streptomyces sp. NBC_00830]
MWPFLRSHTPSPESENAKRDAEISLMKAQARTPRSEAKLKESRRVKEQLKALNRAKAYSDVARPWS